MVKCANHMREISSVVSLKNNYFRLFLCIYFFTIKKP
jgi:hypothetical protein